MGIRRETQDMLNIANDQLKREEASFERWKKAERSSYLVKRTEEDIKEKKNKINELTAQLEALNKFKELEPLLDAILHRIKDIENRLNDANLSI